MREIRPGNHRREDSDTPHTRLFQQDTLGLPRPGERQVVSQDRLKLDALLQRIDQELGLPRRGRLPEPTEAKQQRDPLNHMFNDTCDEPMQKQLTPYENPPRKRFSRETSQKPGKDTVPSLVEEIPDPQSPSEQDTTSYIIHASKDKDDEARRVSKEWHMEFHERDARQWQKDAQDPNLEEWQKKNLREIAAIAEKEAQEEREWLNTYRERQRAEREEQRRKELDP